MRTSRSVAYFAVAVVALFVGLVLLTARQPLSVAFLVAAVTGLFATGYSALSSEWGSGRPMGAHDPHAPEKGPSR